MRAIGAGFKAAEELRYLPLRRPAYLPHCTQKRLILLRRPNTHPNTIRRAPPAQRTHADSLTTHPLCKTKTIPHIAINKIRRCRNHAVSQLRKSHAYNLRLLRIIRHHALYMFGIVERGHSRRLRHR